MLKPLHGIKVLDMSQILAGPYCGMILADLGADVVKVEKPGIGDDARSYPPFNNGDSEYFGGINRNKRGIILDLKDERDKLIFIKLVKTADVLVENFRSGTMKKLGLDFKILSTLNKKLIYAATSGYGQTGPYALKPAYDMIVQALGGIMSITGEDEDHPTRVGSSIGDITAGMYTAIGILAALRSREQSGVGQMVDVSMLDCQLAILENAVCRYFAKKVDPKPIGNRHPSISPFGEVKASDTTFVIAAGNDKLFETLCKTLELDTLKDDSRFITNDKRVENMGELFTIINVATSKMTAALWIEKLECAKVPCAPINKISQAVNNNQVISREMIVEIVNQKGNISKIVNSPIKFSETHCGINMAAPLLGQHTDEVLSEWLGIDYKDKI